MKNKIFGINMKLTDMVIYWKEDVTMNDLMYDLSVIGEMMCKPMFQKKGCKICTVRTNWINDTIYRTCEIVADEKIVKIIECGVREKMFKAVAFTETFITKKK